MNLNNLVSLNGLLHNDHTFKDVVSEVRSNNNPKILSPKEAHAFIISSIIQLFKKPILVISSNPEESRELVDNLNFWSTKTTNLNFNERNEIFLEKYKPDNKNNIERMRCLEALFMGQYGNKLPIICTSIQSITTNTISKDLYKDLSVNLSVGYKISQKELVEKLIFLGYQNSSIVESVGEFAIRGDILDIFTLNKKDPIRIDFLYDSIESIKVFQSSSQISYESLDNIFISPVSETNTFFRTIEDIKSINQEYFKNSNKEEVKSTISDLAKIISGESEELINYYSGFFDKNSVLDFLEDDYLVIKLEKYNLDLEFERINNRRNEVNKSKIENNIINSYFPTPYNKLDDLNERRVSLEINQRSYKNKKHYKLNFSTPKIHKFNQDKIKRYLNENEKNEKVIISTDYPSRVKEILGLNNVEIFDDIQEISNNKFNIVSKNIGQGFKINDGVNFFTVLTDKELFGMKKKRIIKSFSNNIPSTISSEPFKIDDFVVHIDHGIGKFIGTTQIDSTDREFIVLNYKNNDKLYVPSDQIDRIQLYKSFQKEDPSLDTLGSQRWIKSKNRVKKSIEILAVELLQIYAAREKIKGNSYKKSSDWYKVLEESFEFIETADQIKAINEINIDLMSNKPMDRLLCGDVGFGKTEVAIRAALKVVENGYQVAILVPTTVLALQHYETFL